MSVNRVVASDNSHLREGSQFREGELINLERYINKKYDAEGNFIPSIRQRSTEVQRIPSSSHSPSNGSVGAHYLSKMDGFFQSRMN